MVVGMFTSNGVVKPPFIFSDDIELNMEDNNKCLEEVVMIWVERVATGRLYIW